MANHGPQTQQAARPAVVIYTTASREDGLLKPILWGLEEEGIPFRIVQVAGGEPIGLAKQAADASPLNVGISIHGPNQTVCLHHRDLQVQQPLFVSRAPDLHSAALRRLGANAARLVKGDPLLLDEAEPSGKTVEAREQRAADEQELARIVTEIIREIIRQQ